MLGLAVRIVMLMLVGALALRVTSSWYALSWLVLIAAAAVPAVLAPEHRVLGPLSRLAEVVTTCLAAAAIAAVPHAHGLGLGPASASVLPYLTVPIVSATLLRRRFEVPVLLLAAITVLTTAWVSDQQLRTSGYTASSIEWIALTGVAAAVAGTLQYSLLSRSDSPQPYAEATRLLTQLRSVARQLPGATLDPGGLAEHLLDEVRAVAPAERAAVLSTSGGGRLVVLAQTGADRVDWETGLEADSAIADAWASQQPQTANRSQARSTREIHDGVAQELVMVGYGIDNALATLPEVDATTEELRVLRSEVTRVITELRLSLFELRSEVDRYGGLATAIADYARTVGQSAGLRVHLSLDESTARLPAATEAELLRIAQEAITNARKHAGAENLWVTCTIDPPYAEIEVSDDGHGMVDRPKEGRYGLAIMAERAERIRGRLEIRPRIPTGTTVAVVLGSASRRSTV